MVIDILLPCVKNDVDMGIQIIAHDIGAKALTLIAYNDHLRHLVENLQPQLLFIDYNAQSKGLILLAMGLRLPDSKYQQANRNSQR